jgi:aryl-alcohol dehydrogenase-like predicted oxidoreductase
LDAPAPPQELGNRSLTKYKLVIEDFGSWEDFQTLLRVLRDIALKHHTDIATVASRLILDRPQVAAVIIGAVNSSHLASHGQLTHLNLSDQDRASVAHITSQRRGPPGDVYELERDRTGRHGRIMKYNLSSAPI